MAGGAQTSWGDASILFKRHGYRIRALYPTCIGWTVSFVFAGFFPPFLQWQHTIFLWRITPPWLCHWFWWGQQSLYSTSCPTTKMGVVAQAWPTLWPCWLVHMVDRRLKLVSLESFNEIKCADGVSESPVLSSCILSWKDVSFPFLCSTRWRESLEEKQNEINTKKLRWQTEKWSCSYVLWVPGSTAVHSN